MNWGYVLLCQSQFSGGDDAGEVVVPLRRLNKRCSVDTVDFPYVNRAAGVVHSDKPVPFALVAGEEASLLLCS